MKNRLLYLLLSLLGFATACESEKTLELVFEDVDGELNGGDFKSQSLRIEFTEDDLLEEYEQVYGKSDVDIRLTKEQTPAQ